MLTKINGQNLSKSEKYRIFAPSIKIKKNMATCRDKIEHLEHELIKNSEKPWRQTSKSRKWLKKQMNRFMRRQPISDDDIGRKTGRKPTSGYEY